MSLEHELEVFRTHLMDMLGVDEVNEGKYVVIKGDEILGVYESLDDALGAGYERYGDVDFLVKQIHAVEPIEYFSRNLF
jgi:hypothetical protein